MKSVRSWQVLSDAERRSAVEQESAHEDVLNRFVLGVREERDEELATEMHERLYDDPRFFPDR